MVKKKRILKRAYMFHTPLHKYHDSRKTTEEIVKSVVKVLVDNVVIMQRNKIDMVEINREKKGNVPEVIPVRKKPLIKKLKSNAKIFCCVEGCPTRNRIKRVPYYNFPTTNQYKITVMNEFGWGTKIGQLEAWENALQTKRSSRNKRVCYRHFLETDYFFHDYFQQYRLKKDAVPFRVSPPERTNFTVTEDPIIDQEAQEEDPLDTPIDEIVHVVKEEDIDESELPKIDSRCAVCLSYSASYNIFEIHNNITILKMLELCTGYQIDKQEQVRVPGICDTCRDEVWLSYQYREKFIESQNILMYEKEEEISIKKRPFQCFDYFMGEVLNNITDYTNQKIRKLNNDATNVETCKEEIMALVGLLVLAAGSKKIGVKEKELVDWCSGLPNGLVMNYARIIYLTDEITFYDIETNGKPSEKMLFTQFKGVVWDKFLDKCKHCNRQNSTVSRIDFYLQSQTPYPFRNYVEPQENYIIKIISYFDFTNKTLLNVYPWFGQGPYEVEYMSKCENSTITRGFEHLWSSFMFISKKSNGWSMILFYTMLNIALINSYAMHRLNATIVSEEVFLKNLADSLITPWIKKNKSTANWFGPNPTQNIADIIKKIRLRY